MIQSFKTKKTSWSTLFFWSLQSVKLFPKISPKQKKIKKWRKNWYFWFLLLFIRSKPKKSCFKINSETKDDKLKKVSKLLTDVLWQHSSRVPSTYCFLPETLIRRNGTIDCWLSNKKQNLKRQKLLKRFQFWI